MKLSRNSLMIALGVFVDAGTLRTFTVYPDGTQPPFEEDDPTVCPPSKKGKKFTVDQKTVKSYSMPNGHVDYMDGLYCARDFGCYDAFGTAALVYPDSAVPYAFLEGCTGELTDGYIPETSYNVDLEVTKIPYVGWGKKQAVTCNAVADPAVFIDFFFPTDEEVNTICITYDDPPNPGAFQGVIAPEAIEIQGTLTDDLPGDMMGPVRACFPVEEPIKVKEGEPIRIKVFNNDVDSSWVFLSEVEFFGKCEKDPSMK